MAEFPAPAEGIVLTHFIVSSDVDRARRFYADGSYLVMERYDHGARRRHVT